MSGFKLLAIRPLKGCDKSYKKRLVEGEIYKFYQDYRYLDDKGIEISHHNHNANRGVYKIVPPQNDVNLYSRRDLTINISAIVGENGSGKSSLIELFFLAIFIKSSKTSILNLSEKIVETKESIRALESNIKALERSFDHTFEKEYFEIYKSSILKIEALRKQKQQADSHLAKLVASSNFAKNNNLRLEIFIEIGGKIQMISFYTREYKMKSIITEFTYVPDHITELFYTISLNYSLYGLNAIEIGSWIEMLFHKNDGYLTPVVINPMRTNGQIDINKENYLAQNRILANLVDKKLKQKQIIDGKVVEDIQFCIPSKKLENCSYYFQSFTKIEKKNIKEVISFSKIEKDTQSVMINRVDVDVLKFFNIGDDISISLKNYDSDLIRQYISQKLFKIARTYSDYSKFYRVQDSGTEIIDDFKGFISDISRDRTHKTLKLRQLINVIKFGILSNHDAEELRIIHGIDDASDIKWKDQKLRLRFSDYSKLIHHAYTKAQNDSKKIGELELLEFIPNSFFEPQVSFKGEAGFRSLSSGEQQYFNAINTIVYHVLNLDSIPNHFNRINIIFDEIELYFHPGFQRRFISDLIKSLRNLDLTNIKEFNIIFSTHSPFILSDIPSSNILRLKDGVSQINLEETFGANIHQLLHNDFFLENGFIGEFAKNKINEVVDFLRLKKWNSDEVMIKKRIESEKNEVVKTDLKIQLQIIQLQKNRITNVNESLDLEKCENIIDLVGEPLIKDSLNELISEVKNNKLKEK